MLKFILSVFPVQGVTALQLLLTKLGKVKLATAGTHTIKRLMAFKSIHGAQGFSVKNVGKQGVKPNFWILLPSKNNGV